MAGSKANWFVALPVPAGSWLSRIGRNHPDGVRIFAPEDIHMTIAFLGAMEATRKELVIECIRQFRETVFTLTLDRLRPLPSSRFVSALSFEVQQGHTRAVEIITAYRDLLLRIAEAPPDNRAPLPHITIARPNRKGGVRARQESLAWAAQVQPPNEELLINKIALYTWHEDRSTRQFDIIYEQPLDRL